MKFTHRYFAVTLIAQAQTFTRQDTLRFCNAERVWWKFYNLRFRHQGGPGQKNHSW
jgi:hypothetical protein